jgi:hypothetical protein
MSIRALRRLSETELLGLGVALSMIEQTEAQLVEQLGDLRRAAEREQRGRVARGLPGLGQFGSAYVAAYRTLHILTDARMETAYASETGRVPRKTRAKQ